MTRGRPPRQACREACRSAHKRGAVLKAAGIVGSRADFILFEPQRVVFVRVLRSHSRIRTTQEITVRFSCEIALLRTVPQTAVVFCELWVLLPWGSWQYFGISNDGIMEIPDQQGKEEE